jgi:hypothetical protein
MMAATSRSAPEVIMIDLVSKGLFCYRRNEKQRSHGVTHIEQVDTSSVTKVVTMKKRLMDVCPPASAFNPLTE